MVAKCKDCKRNAEFLCPCEYVPLCSDHLIGHITQPGFHACEHLNITLSSTESQSLKQTLSKGLISIKASIYEISSFSASLISLIKSCNKLKIQELNSLSKLYLYLISFDRLSNSLKTQAENVLNKPLIIKQMPMELKDKIKEAFSLKLISYEINEKNNKRVIEESSELKDNDSLLGNYIDIINEVPLNSWPLQKKQTYMENLRIEHYQEWFARSSEKCWPLDEIRFSNDKKYAFSCRIYIGKIKQKIGSMVNYKQHHAIPVKIIQKVMLLRM